MVSTACPQCPQLSLCHLLVSDRVGAWKALPSDGVASLEVFKNRVDVALRDAVSEHGGSWLMIGLGDFGGLFQL